MAEKIGPGADVKIHADPTFGWRAQPIAKRGQAAEFQELADEAAVELLALYDLKDGSGQAVLAGCCPAGETLPRPLRSGRNLLMISEGYLVADAVRRNQSPICLKLPGRGKFPGISQFIREIAELRTFRRPLTWRKPLSSLVNLNQRVVNSLNIGSGITGKCVKFCC